MESLEIEKTRKNDFSLEEREDEEEMTDKNHVCTKSMRIWNVKRRKRSLVSLIVLLFSSTIVYVVVLVKNDNIVVEGYDAQMGKQEGGPGFCDYSKHDQWLKAKISKQDGKMYSVLDTLFHDSSSFTQGLTYKRYGDHGLLFESTGLRGQSKVRILDPLTGATIKSVNMDRELFGEGMTVFNDKLVQITWKSQKGFVYNTTNLDVIETFTFDTTRNEGWGITYDHCKDEFIVTDGSAYMHFWDPSTFKQKRKIAVRRMDGKPAKNLNEVEYWRGKLLVSFFDKISAL